MEIPPCAFTLKRLLVKSNNPVNKLSESVAPVVAERRVVDAFTMVAVPVIKAFVFVNPVADKFVVLAFVEKKFAENPLPLNAVVDAFPRVV